jgi:hypothetical protein
MPIELPFSSPLGLQFILLLLISQLDCLSAHLLACSLLKTIQDGWKITSKLLTSPSDRLSAHLWACSLHYMGGS